MKNLTEIAKKYGTDKVEHGYTQIYEQLFSPNRNKNIKILELGVGDYGASVKTWREYFPNADVYMFDPFFIKSQIVTEEELQNKNIKTIRGNQLSRDDLHAAAENGPFDIIIDDASHINDGIMLSLGVLFKSLVSGGLYIVEDLACATDRSSRLQDVNEWIDSDVVDKSSDVKIIYHQPEFHIRNECVRHFMTTGKWKSRILSEEEGDYIINNVRAIDFQSHHNMIIFQKK
tara:strand:+ start:154 stop:846 length:693 start_codon:yes stop_codon:yes gene_type:complete